MTEKLTPKQQLWQSRLQEADKSGLSLAEYAKHKDLPLKQLYAWRSRFKNMIHSDTAQPLTFAKVQATTQAPSSLIEIKLPNGVSLAVEQHSPELLKILCAV